MRYYMPLKSLAVFLFLSFCVQAVTAQNEEKLDTIYNPKVVYSAIPQKYEIAGITVTGAPNYDRLSKYPVMPLPRLPKNFGGKVCFPMS